MNIRYFFKKLYEFRIVKGIIFFIANLMLVYMISFMFWAGMVSANHECAGDGRMLEGQACPSWSWEIQYTVLSFEEVFIMCASLYFGMILIAIIVILINGYYQIKQADKIYR